MTFFDDAHGKSVFHLMANLSNNKKCILNAKREFIDVVYLYMCVHVRARARARVYVYVWYVYTTQTRTFFTLAHRPLKVNVHADGKINKPIGSPIHARSLSIMYVLFVPKSEIGEIV